MKIFEQQHVLPTDSRTDRQTVGRMDRQSDGRTDRPTFANQSQYTFLFKGSITHCTWHGLLMCGV